MGEYKSMVEAPTGWLGSIPEHWKCKKIGSLFSERKTKVSDADYPPLSVTKLGIVPQLANAAKSDSGDNRKLVCSGDFVINSRSDRKGSCGVSELDGSVVRYIVKDNGIGMSEGFQKKLFKPFSQEDDSGARTQYKGTGLGMAITKEYVHMMGGKIDVESKKGIGTTFTVEIPLELTEQDIHQKQEEPVHRDLTGVNVLMAEDNDLNAELATVMLEDAGMVVTRASDGKEAVERFKNHPRGTYDIILMDIMMPNMDGHQAAKTIRAMEKERPDASSIPIIALSANAFAEDVKASVDSGMNGHISKPFDMEEVTATIAKYVKS